MKSGDTKPESTLTFEVAVPGRQQKFRELIVFIAGASRNDPAFGAVKLNKLMWRADFLAFFRNGVPITGAKYQALAQGPAPVPLLPVKRELIEEGAITEELKEFHGRKQKRIIALRKADTSFFHDSELDLVETIIKDNWGKTAIQLSNESHGSPGRPPASVN